MDHRRIAGWRRGRRGSGLTADNEFSSPVGLWFDRQGVCWIQTDDGGSRQVVNTPANGTSTVTTYVSAASSASAANLRRFLVGPSGCEITGIAMTPDYRTLLLNVQHPGAYGDLATLQSIWPASTPGARPRSPTVVITKNDVDTIGGSPIQAAARATAASALARRASGVIACRPAEFPAGRLVSGTRCRRNTARN